MKIKNLLWLLVPVLFLFSCTGDEELVVQQEKETIATSQDGEVIAFTIADQNQLDDLLQNNQLEVVKGLLHFSDKEVFETFIDLIYKMNLDEYLAYTQSIGFTSFAERTQGYDNDLQMSNQAIATEFPTLYNVKDRNLENRVLFDRIANKEGVYAVGNDLVFQNNEAQHFLLVENLKEMNQEPTYEYVIDHADAQLQMNEDLAEPRVCNQTLFVNIRTYDGGDKRLVSIVRTWASALPRRNSAGQVIGWDVIEGYEYIAASQDDNWFKGWHGENASMYTKIDAYVAGNSNKQWSEKSCGSCNRLENRKATRTYFIPGNNPNIFAPRFNPLEWWMALIRDKTDPALLNFFDCSDGDNINQDLHPEICFNCL